MERQVMQYNKLVRDKIPEIICDQGEMPDFRILEQDEYTRRLEAKLDEEVAEFHRDKNLEELGDILEVTFSLAENLGYTREELLRTCEMKREKRGGFRDRIFLISKE